MKINKLLCGLSVAVLLSCPLANAATTSNIPSQQVIHMANYTSWYYVSAELESYGMTYPHNTDHYFNYANDTVGYNRQILQAMDKVMAIRPDGGGYYTGIGDSPVGYSLALNGYNLINPIKNSSYCSGATYTVFIEALNLINSNYINQMNSSQLDAVRMQRADGTPRPDNELLWGLWNNDFWGVADAMVAFANVGQVIPPYAARPGDFLKIQWTKSSGHFVIFLGWIKGANGLPVGVRYWSSNTGTNGYGESEHSISSIYALLPVRLTNPDNIVTIDPQKAVTPTTVDGAGFQLQD